MKSNAERAYRRPAPRLAHADRSHEAVVRPPGSKRLVSVSLTAPNQVFQPLLQCAFPLFREALALKRASPISYNAAQRFSYSCQSRAICMSSLGGKTFVGRYIPVT